jgi:hypothetical protein
MTNWRRRLDLWLLDLALTTVSFFTAYRVRIVFEFRGHTVMPLQVYLPLLLAILPIWAMVLPLFQVYSEQTGSALTTLWRLTKALASALIITVVAEWFLNRAHLPGAVGGSSRLILLFTVVIDYSLLAAYRVLLIRKQNYRTMYPESGSPTWN